MKVLITGASGLLGREVHQLCLEQKHDTRALAFTRSDPSRALLRLDLTDTDALIACLEDFQPDVIVHTAAERRPDVVENNPAACHSINVQVPATLAKAAAALTSVPFLVNISTDYVFDGSRPPYKVDDEPNPLNAYGVSKLQGERAISQHGASGRFTNLRVPVLYGRTTSNNESAVNVLLDSISPPFGPTMRKCDAYAVRYPTNVQDIAIAILAMASVHAESGKEVPPITHFSAKEAMTKYDMCMVLSRIANSVGLETRTDSLDPEYEVDPMAATARPRHCKLDTSVLEEYGVPVRCTSFEDWWRPYLTEKYEQKLAEEAKLAEAEALRLKEEEDARRVEAEKQQKLEQEKLEQKKLEQEQLQQQEEQAAQERRQKEEDEAEHEQQEQKIAEAEVQQANSSIKDTASATPDRTSAADQDKEGTQTANSNSNPGSPHPSFNSLKARPTPPATSALPSPTSTHPPSSIRSGHRPESPVRDPAALDMDLSSTPVVDIAATPTGSVARESPLNLAAARERDRLGKTLPNRSSSTSSDARLSSLTDESTMFGGSAHTNSARSSTFLSTNAALRRSSTDRRHREESDDEDVYGEPSPREPQVEFSSQAGTIAPDSEAVETTLANEPAAAGAPAQPTVEGAQHPSSQAQSKIYHRPSFDLLQDARDREAYERLHRRNFEFSIKVGDPQKIGDPMTAHIVYTVRSHTNSLAFRSSHFSVLRRYKDFRWLHAALVQNNPGIIVPPVPEKVSIGRFAAELVEARRMGLETCINKVASHPLLQQDDDFRLFLESDNFAADVKHRDLIKGPVETPEQKTYKSWGSVFFGNVVSSNSSLSSGALSAYRFEEVDEWFNEQRLYLDSLESALKGLVKSISSLSNQRKHIVACTQSLSEVVLTLSGSSLSRSLSTCFAGLAEVERRIWELEDGQAEVDVRQIGTTMYEYERVVGSVRKAFQVRTEIWARSARAEDEVRRTRSRFDKYKQSNPTSSGPQFQMLLAEVTESETKALEAERLFNTVSRRCKDEMERLDLERVLDFKRIVTVWLDDMIARQEEVVNEWVQYCALLSRQTGIQVLTPPSPPDQPMQNGTQQPAEDANQTSAVNPTSEQTSQLIAQDDSMAKTDVKGDSVLKAQTAAEEPHAANEEPTAPAETVATQNTESAAESGSHETTNGSNADAAPITTATPAITQVSPNANGSQPAQDSEKAEEHS